MRKRNNKNDSCFIEISNNEIYEELLNIKNNLNCMKTKIKLNTWLSSTALSLVIGLTIGFIFK